MIQFPRTHAFLSFLQLLYGVGAILTQYTFIHKEMERTWEWPIRATPVAYHAGGIVLSIFLPVTIFGFLKHRLWLVTAMFISYMAMMFCGAAGLYGLSEYIYHFDQRDCVLTVLLICFGASTLIGIHTLVMCIDVCCCSVAPPMTKEERMHHMKELGKVINRMEAFRTMPPESSLGFEDQSELGRPPPV